MKLDEGLVVCLYKVVIIWQDGRYCKFAMIDKQRRREMLCCLQWSKAVHVRHSPRCREVRLSDRSTGQVGISNTDRHVDGEAHRSQSINELVTCQRLNPHCRSPSKRMRPSVLQFPSPHCHSRLFFKPASKNQT